MDRGDSEHRRRGRALPARDVVLFSLMVVVVAGLFGSASCASTQVGSDFLSHFVVTIDLRAKKLVLALAD
jgi:hypothetical protein